MADLDTALAYIFGNEGYFVDDPDDHGGATRLGITQADLALFLNRPVTVVEVRAVTVETATAIYRRWYWNPLKGDSLKDQSVATALLDSAILNGSSTTIKMAQNIVGVTPDGIMGPNTFFAVNGCRNSVLIKGLIKLLTLRYEGIVANDPTQAKFLVGWNNRANRLATLIS